MQKLKKQYRVNEKSKDPYDLFYSNKFPSKHDHWFRKFSTKQERSKSQLDLLEYKEYGIKIRTCRSNNLVDSWDDIPSSSRWSEKSWKHHSRRRNQWYKNKKDSL